MARPCEIEPVDSDDDSGTGSDMDSQQVEVTFSSRPSGPYRRKSSLVSHNRPRRPTDCIVHQFLESQRLAGIASTSHRPADAGYGPGQGSRSDLALRSVELISTAGADSADPTEAQSRLLTKKQLSEMAWGVRELSRRLGNMRVRFTIRNIFLLTKPQDRDLVVKTRDLVRWLLDERARGVRYTVYVERSLCHDRVFDAPGLLDEIHRAQKSAELDQNPDQQPNRPQNDAGDSSPDNGLVRRLRYWDEKVCPTRPHTFDLVITLGGDGTVLYASWLFQRVVPPVLSFSLGSLGFLTKFDFDRHHEILDAAFSRGVTVSLRLRFEGTVMRSTRNSHRRLSHAAESLRPVALPTPASTTTHDFLHGPKSGDDDTDASDRDLIDELVGEEKDDERTHWPDCTYAILNEIVVDRGPNPTLSSLEVFGDDEHFTSLSADGVCISTPTGSTAYNLAAGGSLCHPENPVMLLTAICAHTLSSRPIILPDTVVLRVGVPYDARTSSWASFDGQERVRLDPGDYVTVSASRFPFAAVRASPDGNHHLRGDDDWVASISRKLGWNTRQRQKAFT